MILKCVCNRPVSSRALNIASMGCGKKKGDLLVMIPRLEKIDALAADEVDESVLLRDATRPGPGQEML